MKAGGHGPPLHQACSNKAADLPGYPGKQCGVNPPDSDN